MSRLPRTPDLRSANGEALRARALESISDAVIVAGVDNRIVFANEAVCTLLGWEASQLEGEPLVTVIPPRFRPRHLAAFHRFQRTGEATILGHAIRVPALRRDGTEVDIDLTLSPFEAGGQRYVLGSLRDAGPRVEIEREAELTRLLLRALTRATTLGEATSRILEVLCRSGRWDAGSVWTVDEAAGEMRCLDFWKDPDVDLPGFEEATRASAFPRGVGLPGRVWALEQAAWIGDVQADANFPRAEAAARSGVRTGVAFPVTAQGRLLGVIEMFSLESRELDAGFVRSVAAIGEELGRFIQGKRLERDLEERNRRLRFLADASRILGSSFDHRATVQQVARSALPTFADWCAVDVHEGGRVNLLACAHVDPDAEPLIAELRRRYPPDPRQLPWVLHVVRSGSPMLHARIEDSLVAATTRDDGEAALLSRLGLRSVLVVPLVSKAQVLGALTLASGPGGRTYTQDDVGFAEDLGRRIALAIENARLYETQARIAQTLQEALLPAQLPEIAGIDRDASYRPARTGGDVGGDFYDLFPVPGGWCAVIGDVSGKGVQAASITAMVRYAVRTAALTTPAPTDILSLANRAVSPDLPEQRYCTVSLATIRLDGDGARVCVTCAGHPPPLLVRADGQVVEACTYGQALGLVDDPAIEDREVHLEAGDLLLFYTDGVSDCWPDHEGLLESARAVAGSSAAEAVARIEADALEAAKWRQRDDMALLAIRITGLGS